MKRHANSLLVLAMAAVGLAGCGPQSSTPLAASPGTKPVVEAPNKLDVTGSEPKPLRKKEDPFWSEKRPRTEITGPLTRTSAEISGESFPTTESKPPDKAATEDSAATRPKADREPTKPGDPEKITFDDLILSMQADMVYRPFMLTDRAKELEGKRVRLSGNMLPYDGTKAKEFIILRNKECKYGVGGQADHVADVLMKEGHKATFTLDTIRVEGTLRIAPVNGDDGNTKHIYVLEEAVLK
ncbi:MAG: hypothetical protein IAF94_02185 [Pirellulaceae bacterium]|nr:hypothetical protein [Pirellulaceae bacterium]